MKDEENDPTQVRMISAKHPKKIGSAEQTTHFKQTTAVCTDNSTINSQNYKTNKITTSNANGHSTPTKLLHKAKERKISNSVIWLKRSYKKLKKTPEKGTLT